MNITLTIQASPELVNAIQSLAVAISGTKISPVISAPAVTEEEVKQPEKPKRGKAKQEEAPIDEPSKEEPVQEESVKEEPAAEPENIPSVVELRAKAQEKGKTPDGKKAIKALLDQFGSKSISDVPEESRAAFLAELEAL